MQKLHLLLSSTILEWMRYMTSDCTHIQLCSVPTTLLRPPLDLTGQTGKTETFYTVILSQFRPNVVTLHKTHLNRLRRWDYQRDV